MINNKVEYLITKLSNTILDFENTLDDLKKEFKKYAIPPYPNHECSMGTIMCRETLTGLQLTITNRSDIGSRQINFCPFCGYKAKVQI